MLDHFLLVLAEAKEKARLRPWRLKKSVQIALILSPLGSHASSWVGRQSWGPVRRIFVVICEENIDLMRILLYFGFHPLLWNHWLARNRPLPLACGLISPCNPTLVPPAQWWIVPLAPCTYQKESWTNRKVSICSWTLIKMPTTMIGHGPQKKSQKVIISAVCFVAHQPS